MIEFKDEKTKITFKGHKVQGHFFETIGFVFKIFSTVDKNEKSQDKHIVGYFSVVVFDGASALGKMEAWNPQMFQSLQKQQMIHHVIQEGLLYIWIL